MHTDSEDGRDGFRSRSEVEAPETEISALLRDLWIARRLIALVIVVCSLAGAAYAFIAPTWYRAEVSLYPAGRRSISGALGQLSALAGITGVTLPGSEGSEPVAVLKSKSLIRDFIVDQDLLPVLFQNRWNASTRSWSVAARKVPDLRDGVRYFDENIRTVSEDKKSGLVTLSIRWHDPELAARWANMLAQRLNARVRAKAISEAQSSIEYLQKEMLQTPVVSLQQSIGRVLEGQMESMSLARSNEEFAFKVVDVAVPPKFRDSPKRVLIIVLSALGGFALGVLIVLGRESIGRKLM
jgi:uncharacterized protein involved in exopolysaccharide biosynthesis